MDDFILETLPGKSFGLPPKEFMRYIHRLTLLMAKAASREGEQAADAQRAQAESLADAVMHGCAMVFNAKGIYAIPFWSVSYLETTLTKDLHFGEDASPNKEGGPTIGPLTDRFTNQSFTQPPQNYEDWLRH
jgi:hypothetical protein